MVELRILDLVCAPSAVSIDPEFPSSGNFDVSGAFSKFEAALRVARAARDRALSEESEVLGLSRIRRTLVVFSHQEIFQTMPQS